MISVRFPWPPKELSPNARVHWTKKARKAKQYRADCYLLAKAAKARVAGGDMPVLLAVEFWPQTNRKRDEDNLIASCKSLFDGLADALGVNDSRFRIGRPQVMPAGTKYGAVVVHIKNGSEA